MKGTRLSIVSCAVMGLALLAVLAFPGTAFAQSSSGAMLQASKTLDICVQPDGTWKYFGEVSVWNTGTNAAEGLNISDCIQYKTATQKGQPVNLFGYCLSNL
jgi:hypothetical protein